MSYFINKTSEERRRLLNKQVFFAVDTGDLIPDDVAKRIQQIQEDADVVDRYLTKVEGFVRTRTQGIGQFTEELPECLAEAPSGEQPSGQGSAPRSSKKSPGTRKKKASSSSTSRKKAG